MKVLLLGSNGMLGQAIKKRLVLDGEKVFGVDRTDAEFCFDLTNDLDIESCIKQVIPDVLVNAAAIVDINVCEKEPGLAYQVNGRLPGILAELCRKYGGYLVQVSTDHYYHGHESRRHKESDAVELVNEYARSKYVGERLALTYGDSLILRTNIVGFRVHGNPTFVEWVLQAIRDGNSMSLFSDFYTSSICVSDFAGILSDLLRRRPRGVYNLASSSTVSKKQFILALSKAVFGYEPEYNDASVKDIQGVKRGNSLGLDTAKIERLLGYRMPDLDETVRTIAKEYEEMRDEV